MKNKTALVFLYFCDHMAIDVALSKYKEGYELLFVGCDKTIGICHPNPIGNRLYCDFCKWNMNKQVHSFFNDNHIPYKHLSIRDLITPEIKANANKLTFRYNSVKDLKSIIYKDVEIGYGAFSTYVSFTRNITPSINAAFHEYIDNLLRSEVMMIDAIEGYLKLINPDLVIFHNGRFNNVKPFLGLCERHQIDFIATESQILDNGQLCEDDFYNISPHSIDAISEKMDKAWVNAGEKRTEIGNSFFENRRKGKRAGDIVYTAKQKDGELPNNFTRGVHNIAIFNSSEDEFFAISKEYDEGVMFPNQYDALKMIFDHYKGREDYHFYLRIHPNLGNVPYLSHMSLYTLVYDNVTIIPPYASVSSYALMEACEKVIVFNSTMGVESAYWGKPVIALSHCMYSCLNVEYEPKSTDELFELINNENLRPINNKEACLKAACYLMGYHTKEYKNISPYYYRWKFLGQEFRGTSLYTLFGSRKIYSFAEKCLFYSFVFSKKCRRYWKIASLTK